MRALVCKEYGPPESLVLEERPDPQPGPEEVRVEVKAAGINFPDVLVIAGNYQVVITSYSIHYTKLYDYTPNPWIYWTDFLFSASLGWGAFVLAVRAPAFSASQAIFYLTASLALYRAVIFTHELAHLRKSTFRLFRLVWNLGCGFALMVPSYMYGGVHNDHHKRT